MVGMQLKYSVCSLIQSCHNTPRSILLETY